MYKKSKNNGNLYFLIAFLVMAVLFYSSSQTYQEQSQIGLLSKLLKGEPFKKWLLSISFTYAGHPVSVEASGYFAFVEFFIRKFAHFSTYFILGGSLFLGLYQRTKSLSIAAFFGWMAATGYAGTDEFHQMLTGGRTPLFQDVMLDSVGALTAVLLGWLFLGIKKKKFFS